MVSSSAFLSSMKSTTHSFAWVLLTAICLPLIAAEPRRSTTAGKESAAQSAPRREADTARESVPRDNYILQPQDVLRVHVFQEDEINRQGEVSLSGEATITLPLIGTVELRDKTARQAEEIIRKLYGTYLVKPQVTVSVVKYSDRSASVIGAVNQAGKVQFPQERGLTLLEAISLAGGHSRLADLKKVRLTRRGETNVVDVNEITKNGAPDVPLEVGDLIFVPERIL